MSIARLVYVVTDPLSARYLLRGQLAYMQQRGFEVYLVCSPSDDLAPVGEREGVSVIGVPMHRGIKVQQDLVSLFRLCDTVRKLKPDIVHASTPKAGLLGMLAARLCGVPVRIYLVRGLRLETTAGLMRAVLTATERLSSACATRVLCVSQSVRRLCVEKRLSPNEKTAVLARGSSNGVDPTLFVREPALRARSSSLRRELGLTTSDRVIGFVGRLTRDKGIVDLFDAFRIVLRTQPNAKLVIVGDFESGDPIPEEARTALSKHPRVVLAGFAEDVAPYYATFDILAFPSHREGFPNAPLEAACAEVPTVGYRATGVVDAVQDGVTGILTPRGDIGALAQGILRYLSDDSLRLAHGRCARERAIREFSSEIVWSALADELESLLAQEAPRAASPLSPNRTRGARSATSQQ